MAFVLILPALAGCTVGPNYTKPSLWSPASWFRAASPAAEHAAESDPRTAMTAAPIEAAWWTTFRDPVLTRLVRRVATSNLDVRTAALRLEESRAQRRIVGADAYPQVNGNGSYTRERVSPRGVASLFGGPPGGGGNSAATQSNGLGGRQGGFPTGASTGGTSIPPFNLFQYGFDASWELDFWGRVRREIEQANASTQAAEEARNEALLSTMAEVARDYVQLRGAQRAEQLAREDIAAARQSLALTTQRAKGGVATDLDVANAQATLASVESELPQYVQQEGQLINALSFLLGETPGALTSELATRRPVPPAPAIVPIGLPSQLAERRPDIRQAEDQLHAATAAIGVAEADYYPRITLSGSLALQALQLKSLGNWDARTYGFGPSISLPIFQGGRIRQTVRLRKAQQKEAAVNFQKTVLQAFQDVDNALIAYHSEQRRRRTLQTAVNSNRLAVELATRRFRNGVSSYIEVLTAQRSLFAADQQLASSEAQASVDLVQLYKALGGGWQTVQPPGHRPAKKPPAATKAAAKRRVGAKGA